MFHAIAVLRILQGTPTVQILVAPSAMNATTLSDRCAPEIGKGASAEIFKALT